MIAAPNRGGLRGIVKEEKVVTSCKLHEWLDMIITIYCIEYGGQFLSDLIKTSIQANSTADHQNKYYLFKLISKVYK